MRNVLMELYCYVFHKGLEFDNDSEVFNWRNHVPQKIKDVWELLSVREKLLVVIMASKLADTEQWD